jgi:hypothetical protein
MSRMDTPSRAASSPREPRLGVDIGRVIIAGDGPDTSFVGGSEEDALRAPAIAGAFEALARLRVRFDGRVWLVSKCGARVQARTHAWLDHHRFFEETGIERAHLRFCRARHEKAPICGELRITCFIDDRLDVLDALEGIVTTRLLFGSNVSSTPGVTAVPDWIEAERAAVAASECVTAGAPDSSVRRGP